MISKKKNILNIRGTSYGVIVIRACIFIVTLFLCSSIALALNWQDKEAGEDACTKTAIGEWKSGILNFHNVKTIDIQDNKIVIIGNPNSDEHFLQNKHSFKVGDKLIEFDINTVDREKEIYLKVRPHLVTSKIDYGNNYHNC